jgi:hypothetical protein
LRKFQNFEKIQIARNHVELDGYCKDTLVFARRMRKTAKTSKTSDLKKKKSIFQNLVKMKLSPKI